MWMTTEGYIKRMMNALEQVVAPEIEDDAARGQLYAVVELLNQLVAKVEYKPGLIAKEVEEGRAILEAVLGGTEEAGIETPEGLAKIVKEFESESAVMNTALKAKVEEAVCGAINHFHENKGALEPGAVSGLDRNIRDYILKSATRDMGLMKPPNVERISRSKRPEKK
jgi:hypothetical protein